MLRLQRQAVACHGQSVGNQRLVLLDCFIDRESGGHVLNHCTHADRQAAGLHLTAHNRVDELLLSALRVALLELLDPDVGIWQLAEGLLHRLDGFRLVLFYCKYARTASEHALHDGSAHDYLLGALKHYAEVAGEVRLALGTIDNQALSLASGSRVEFHVGREGRASEAHNAAFLDFLKYGGPV